ncbi:MAG TPA: CCA tRNA nucleotidyltransferase [Nitrososphaeraceae archaeon]|jgi:tRNA nucleotidyltransferase (CCA-adding enzyme)|nr:CCA tRNA nucleotidyltransferase [Nitrososphaeraceae archaeon]
MNKIDSVIQQAVESSAPSKPKQVKLEKISKEIQKEIANFKDNRISRVLVGGSFAKGTWLESDTDIDFFVMIEPSVERNEFEELGKSIGYHALRKYKPYLRYSEHPYVEGKVDGTRVNIVPCYRVEKSKWKSAADRSPFHTDFMQDKLNDNLKSQVRVLKKFLKAVGIYGSQIAVSGFSGYVTEVLVLKYGSFEGVLKLFSEFEPNHIISLYPPDEKIVEKFASPIIIIDPIDSNRNLGAAISADCVAKFALASRQFLKNPSIEFMRKSGKLKPKIIKQIESNLLIIEFKIQKRSPDILWGQLKRKLTSISKMLSNSRFEIIKKYCYTDEDKHAVFIFIFEYANLPKITVNRGPEVYLKSETDAYIKKRGDKSIMMWTDGMRIQSIEETKSISIKQYANEIIKKDIQTGSRTGITLDLKNGYLIYLGNEKKRNNFVVTAINHMIGDGEFIR